MTFSRLALLLALLVAHVAASAAPPDDDLLWLCWLSSRPAFALSCQLEVDPLLEDDPSPAADALATPVAQGSLEAVDNAQIRRALFAPGVAPNVARLVREQPARYARLVWTIPLYGPPIEDAHVRELAHSVFCGASPRCSAHYGTLLTPVAIAAR